MSGGDCVTVLVGARDVRAHVTIVCVARVLDEVDAAVSTISNGRMPRVPGVWAVGGVQSCKRALDMGNESLI